MKIIKENHMKHMTIIRTYENHMKRHEHHKRKSFEKLKIMRKYEKHMNRNENHFKQIMKT